MIETLGARIARLRKELHMTQEELGNKLNVTSQAVSKWETDLSAPDIASLTTLSKELGVSVDYLLSNKNYLENSAKVIDENERKDLSKMMFRIMIDSTDGDKVRVNIPVSIIKMCIDTGLSIPDINGSKTLSTVDWNQVFMLIEKGVVGDIISVESANGDKVNIFVE